MTTDRDEFLDDLLFICWFHNLKVPMPFGYRLLALKREHDAIPADGGVYLAVAWVKHLYRETGATIPVTQQDMTVAGTALREMGVGWVLEAAASGLPEPLLGLAWAAGLSITETVQALRDEPDLEVVSATLRGMAALQPRD